MSIPESIQEVYDKATCLHDKKQVEAAMDRMADAIRERLHESYPVVLCVMIGGVLPTAGLLSRMDFPLEVDYIHATRYRGALKGGDIAWKHKPDTSLKNRTVLIIDDILDGGITLAAIIEYCKLQGAREVLTAVLVDKEETRLQEGLQRADFVGLKVEDKYVFGYGMDYREYLRNAPGIYMVADEHA